MNVKLETEQPLTDAACRDATGKTMKEWFAELDARDAIKDGRRNTVASISTTGRGLEWWPVTIAVEYEKHAGQKKKDGLYEGYGICVTKSIAASVADVYAAWTDGTSLSKWFGTGAKADVSDGGEYSTKDGDKGKYLRVRQNKDLRFSWEDPKASAPTLVDVMFADKGGGKTLVTMNHTRIQTRQEADGLRAAWGEALGKLKEMLEK